MKKTRSTKGRCHSCQKKILCSHYCRKCREKIKAEQAIWKIEERERQDVNKMERLL